MEKICGKKFGDKENPLLVSVRSGARASMPGMMDTILNLGLNEDVVNTIAAKSGNPRWAWDCYRSVNATPVPQLSPMLPKAIICTLTAVPQL